MNERLVITALVLVGFFITVMVYMLAPIGVEKQTVMQLIMTSEGTACAMVLGWWFSPKQ